MGFVLHFSVPWLGVGGEGYAPRCDDTVSTGQSQEWVWAHETRECLRDLYGPRAAARPDSPPAWGLAALIVGASVSAGWLVLTFLLPPSFLTPKREAGFAAFLAVPLYLGLIAGAHGNALALQLSSLPRWAVSPAAILALLGSLAGVAVLAAFLRERLDRRAPIALLAGTLVAVALFHLAPWMTTDGPDADDEMSSTWRWLLAVSAARASVPDPLAPLAAGLLVAVLLGIAWVAAVAFLPSSPRSNAVVDGLFAIAGVVPLVLGLHGAGDLFGDGVASALGTAPGWGFSFGAVAFVIALVALAVLLARTLRASVARLDEGASA